MGAFSQPAATQSFAYDALNHRTQRSATGIDQRFTFDALNQLTPSAMAANTLQATEHRRNIP